MSWCIPIINAGFDCFEFGMFVGFMSGALFSVCTLFNLAAEDWDSLELF